MRGKQQRSLRKGTGQDTGIERNQVIPKEHGAAYHEVALHAPGPGDQTAVYDWN